MRASAVVRAFETRCDGGRLVELRLVRLMADPEAQIDRRFLDAIRRAIGRSWEPLWERPELAGNAADAGWDWDQVLSPWAHLPGRVDRVSGSLVALVSKRDGPTLEGLLRVAYPWGSVGLDPAERRGRRAARRPEVCFVDTLAAAPWNRAALPAAPARIGGVGTMLLRTAARLSLEAGFGGLLALHPAPSAFGWYRKLLPDSVVFDDGREYGLLPGPAGSSDPYIETLGRDIRGLLGRPGPEANVELTR